MAGSVLFATSYIAANENRILSYDKLVRMIECGNVFDAVKVLYEVPYADGQTIASEYEYEKLLSMEERRLYEFIKSLCPNEKLLNFFICRNDYHNLKVMLKSKYGKIPLDESLLYSTTTIDKDNLLTFIQNETYAFLPGEMKIGISKLDSMFIASKLTPQDIDLILDKAYMQFCLSLSKGIKSRALKKYLQLQIDFANMLCIIRLKKLGEQSNLEDYFIGGGSYSYDDFVRLYNLSHESFYDYFKYTDYKSFANDLLQNNYLAFEKNTQNYMLSIFKQQKSSVFTVDPIIGYFLAKQSEIKNVRVILTGLYSHIDTSLIKERLRDCYV